jgi:hydrogenase maturation protein HypF
VALPGADRAVTEPWRMACAWLLASGDAEIPELPAPLKRWVAPRRWADVARLARNGLAAPTTTSAGRLLDAVAALCGVRSTVTYEGQAAIELEALADRAERRAYPLEIIDDLILDARPTIRAVAQDIASGATIATISARAHNALATATAAACTIAAERSATDIVVLSGGVFQNRLLLETCTDDLTARGLRVLHPERLPCNDGGISYGQAAVAAAVATTNGAPSSPLP